jgi:hypothetical protein
MGVEAGLPGTKTYQLVFWMSLEPGRGREGGNGSAGLLDDAARGRPHGFGHLEAERLRNLQVHRHI